MEEQLVESWLINDRINRYLLEAIADGGLAAKSPAGGRSVGEQLAHLHNVRLMWLKSGAPELLEGLEKIEKQQVTDSRLLSASLDASGHAIAALIRMAGAEGGRVKGFKPHVGAFVGYLISHESHHRGQIALILKQAGMPLDRKITYGMWEWGVR